VLGAGVVVTAYAIALALRPGDTVLALGVAAFVAFVPMHLTMMASVNNDALAELLLAVVMLLLIRLAWKPSREGQASTRLSYLALIGLLLGLGLVTKATVYVAIPLALVALVLLECRPRPLAQQALALFGPALVLAIPWYVRNVAVYGWPDLLGTLNHDAVVVGQLRTPDYVATVGWPAYLKNFFTTSFHSFWGQFGWMAVPMDRRIYLALGLLSALMVVGIGLAVWRGRGLEGWQVGRPEDGRQTSSPSDRSTIHPSILPSFQLSIGAGLVALWLILTSLMYVYYNISLVQFQGRYLFPALVPIGLLATLGLLTILSRRWVLVAALICGLAAVIIGVGSALSGDLDKWGLLIAAGATLALVVRRWLPAYLDRWILVVVFAGLAGLSIYSLFVFIVPYLSP